MSTSQPSLDVAQDDILDCRRHVRNLPRNLQNGLRLVLLDALPHHVRHDSGAEVEAVMRLDVLLRRRARNALAGTAPGAREVCRASGPGAGRCRA